MNHSLELGLSGFHWAGRHELVALTDSPTDVQSSQTLPGNSDVLSIYPKPNLQARFWSWLFSPSSSVCKLLAATRWLQVPGNRYPGLPISPTALPECLSSLRNPGNRVTHHVLLNPMDGLLPPKQISTVTTSYHLPQQCRLLTIAFLRDNSRRIAWAYIFS